MRLEESGRVVIVEGQSRRAPSERVGCNVCAAAENSGLEMRVAVAAISQRSEYALQVGHINDEGRAIHSERLLEAQVPRLAAEVARLEQLEGACPAVVVVRARRHPVGRVDY